MKIVINAQYGGFGLSKLATEEYLKLKGKKSYFYSTECDGRKIYYKKIDSSFKEDIFTICFTKDLGESINGEEIPEKTWESCCFSAKAIKRTDKDLIKIVEKLKEKANTICSSLKIIEIPDNVDYEIEEYDGNECEDYKPVMRCKSFTAAIEIWQENLREELKKSEQV